MGLSSAMNTALTGINAAETQLDVAGNNLANAQTVGFKASSAVFATQFMRTLSLGSAPNDSNGGTNPRQEGLGVQVAEISPDFGQGTIEISSSPSDLAIQGDGFFVVEGNQGEHQYTRNGIFRTNSGNELVTATGDRLLGFGIDDEYNIQNTQLVPLTVPLGNSAVTKPTENVSLAGNLDPNAEIADTAEVIESGILGDSIVPQPDVNGSNPTRLIAASVPDSSGVTGSSAAGTSGFVAGDQYEYSYAFVDGNGNETMISDPVLASVGANDHQLTLSSVPASPNNPGGTPEYDFVNIYRRKVGVAASDPEFNYQQVGNVAQGSGSFTDNGITPGSTLNDSALSGAYSYVVTFSGPGAPESRPSSVLGPVNVTNGRFHLDDLPPIPTGSGIPNYTTVNIYRNVVNDSTQFYLVDSVAPGTDYTDSRSDSEISDLTNPANRALNLDGPTISTATLLTNVLTRDGMQYQQLFNEGMLTFGGTKGDVDMPEREFEITDTSTVADLMQFLTHSLGIQTSAPGAANPIPGSIDNITGGSALLEAGGTVTSDGRLRLIGNNGMENAIAIKGGSFALDNGTGISASPNLIFGSVQEATGNGAVTNFEVYDSLGTALDVRVTAVLESRDSDTATYRWFADSSQNDVLGSDGALSVGTGLITFDNRGNMISATDNELSIQRADVPASSPLLVNMNFDNVSGVSAKSEFSVSGQDGSGAGTLTGYNIGEDGVIKGVFSNGQQRDLGQIRLARFANPNGLEQKGANLFAQGINSGLPVLGNPGDLGLGGVVAGALELSNTDVGENLIDLVLSSTMYRSNSRVISTAQQMLDELLNLRR